ncbi:MAG: hypothetical protein AAB480_03525 [Patescibacteria group bacterium]
MTETRIANLVRVFELISSLPTDEARVNEARKPLMDTLLAQDTRSLNARARDVVGFWQFYPKANFGVPIFEALFVGHYANIGEIMSVLEKEARDNMDSRLQIEIYPVLVTSLLLCANWCNENGEVANTDFQLTLPVTIGRLLGRWVMLTEKLPQLDGAFVNRYSGALAHYLHESNGNVAFQRATKIFTELESRTNGSAINEGAFSLVNELVRRATLLFCMRSQIEMLKHQLDTAHITKG